ncbi:MAG TPA: hypothetical protein PKW23_07165 [Dictyoglomaceae bacterium]|nr:hypothetical protein [Dictyoglomaceae bacterium]HOL39605.1 hypothetical protein [Dictyoglomaceae bacterium]HPP16551.1 hypothetical protein [Dictyoglomaceae bacterium]
MKKFSVFLLSILLITLISGCNLPQPTQESLIQNGDFDNNTLNYWTILHGSSVSDDWYINADSGYIHWYRSPISPDGGLVGAYQDIDYDLTGITELLLSFDVIIYNQQLSSDGFAGVGEYPAGVNIFFEDGSGNQYVYEKCFLKEGSTINYPENNVSLIPLGTWYQFEFDLMSDPNIASQIASHPILKQIKVFGSGWSFEGGMDNIILLAH